MKEFIIPRKTLRLWQARACFLGVIILIICVMLTKLSKLFWITAAVAACILAAVIFWYLPQLFKTCECKTVNDTVVIKIGVIIKKIHVFPLLRLIYTQTFTTPLAKWMGLTCISLKAARNRIFIPEMLEADANRLLEALSKGESNEI